MYNANALKIGMFGANCSSSRTATKAPERWSASWPDCLALGKMADEAGIDFMLPIGRWKGYGGDTDFHGSTLETMTWACGLLAATKRITVFGTVHAPLFNPIIAAKEFVTADHIGEGRFGLNIVAGWNEGEFEMFGVEQRDHETRYDYAQEWLDAVRRAWTEPGTFDFEGRFFKLKGVRAFPKPYGGTRPLIMNAGSSGTGQAFALRNCDAFFTATSDIRASLDAAAKKVQEVKAQARSLGREIEVYTVGQVVCRPTQKEADEFYHYANIENADWGAVERMLELRNITRQNTPPAEYEAKRKFFAGTSIGGFPFVGTPDKVAEELATVGRAGVRGIAVSFVNYLDDLPFFRDEVLPRLPAHGALRVTPKLIQPVGLIRKIDGDVETALIHRPLIELILPHAFLVHRVGIGDAARFGFVFGADDDQSERSLGRARRDRRTCTIHDAVLLQLDLVQQVRLGVLLHLFERHHALGHDDPELLAQHLLAQFVDGQIAHVKLLGSVQASLDERQHLRRGQRGGLLVLLRLRAMHEAVLGDRMILQDGRRGCA